MGLFDFLFGSNPAGRVKEMPDRIWMTDEAKLNGVRTQIEECLNTNSAAILLVAHFPDMLAEMAQIAGEYSTDYPVTATLAEDLTTDIANHLHTDEDTTIDLIAGERHPLPGVDKNVLDFAAQLPCRTRVTHHLSLEDPLLAFFAGGWVKDMLSKLGMKENEAIESAMVDRRIKGAQKKIADEAFGNISANSAIEWMEKNMPKKEKAE